MSTQSTPLKNNSNNNAVEKLRKIKIEEMRIVGKYMQEFAGQNRSTRDISILDSMIDGLIELKKKINKIKDVSLKQEKENGLQSIERNLKLYLEEKDKIKEAKENPSDSSEADFLKDVKERSNDLGMDANRIIGKYMTNFSHKERVDCDENELSSMVDDLQEIENKMVTMMKDENHHDEYHLRNMIVVKRSLELYRTEHEKIVKAKNGDNGDEDEDTEVQSELVEE